jgi:hypothetical protein
MSTQLRLPRTIPLHNPHGHLSCVLAQIEWVFGTEDTRSDPWRIDAAIGWQWGQPMLLEQAIDYLLARAYHIRQVSPHAGAKVPRWEGLAF